ncbi:COG3173 Predicted aminoglycoside phosphotransferase [Sphingomonadaceae bacterium]
MTNVLDEQALRDWLTEHIAGFQGPASISKFPGGQSNPTYRIDALSGSYVLRRKPFGKLLPSAHAIDREFRLLSALWPLGFPVPKPFALCEDLKVIGAVFYVMEMSAGQNHWDGGLPSLSGAQRRTTYLAMVDTLAELHRIDVPAAGLEDFGKSGNYFERQVARWTRQYRQSQTEHIEEIERLIEWLPSTIPPQTRSSIVHGDYRIDNLIFDKDDKVRAVLDWELSTLGDPLADFSYFALQWVLPFDGGAALDGLDLSRLNIPTLEEIVARYCSATDREGLPNLDWYFAYNLFRAAGIVQGIKKRIMDGTASHAQAHEMAARVQFYAQRAWVFALSAQSRDGSL